MYSKVTKGIRKPTETTTGNRNENNIISLIQNTHGTVQGHPTGNFDEISVRESLPVLRLSDNALPKSY